MPLTFNDSIHFFETLSHFFFKLTIESVAKEFVIRWSIAQNGTQYLK